MSALPLPTDGCPNCVTEAKGAPVHPHRVIVGYGGHEGLRAWYRCPDCRHSWWCSWSIDALTLVCPGCDLCQPAADAA
jgi:hypothetical protein